jgi:hypothetical protein
VIAEAWGHRDHGARTWDAPHLVSLSAAYLAELRELQREGTPAAPWTGRTLCGKDIEPIRLDRDGTAAGVQIAICGKCRSARARLVDRATPAAPVIGLAAARQRRGRAL